MTLRELHERVFFCYLWERQFDRDLRDVLMRLAASRGNRFWCLT